MKLSIRYRNEFTIFVGFPNSEGSRCKNESYIEPLHPNPRIRDLASPETIR